MKRDQNEKLFLDFISELDILTGTGFDILTSIELFGKTLSEGGMRASFEDALRRVRSGQSVSQALFEGPFPHLPRFYRAVFTSAEKSGTFVRAVSGLKQFVEKKRAFEHHVRKILIYPAVTISMAGLALCIVLFHFLPSLASVYRGMDVPLPAVTRIVIAIGERSSLSASIVISLAAAAAASLFALVRNKPLLARTRPFSRLAQWFQSYFLAFHLSMLLDAGFGPVESLEILAEDEGDGAAFSAVLERLKNGEDLGAAICSSFVLPPAFRESLSLGMRTGTMDRTFHYLFMSSQKKLDEGLAYAAAFAEPALILITAALVGLIVMAGLYPLLTLSELAGGL
jgi:type II secretory pathway component PulF